MKRLLNLALSQGEGAGEKFEIKIVRQHISGIGWYVGFYCKKDGRYHYNWRYMTLPILEYGDDLKHWLSVWLGYFKSDLKSSSLRFDSPQPHKA